MGGFNYHCFHVLLSVLYVLRFHKKSPRGTFLQEVLDFLVVVVVVPVVEVVVSSKYKIIIYLMLVYH